MGTPVDPVPESAQAALIAASNAPGYPLTHGTPEFRGAVAQWLADSCEVLDYPEDAVLPTLGLKEAVAWLPTLLGLGPEHTVVIPSLAYPTYEVGAVMAGAQIVRADSPADWPTSGVDLVWLNSPANPTGAVLAADQMAQAVAAARDAGATVASDECYLELWWTDNKPTSVLHPSINGGRLDGLLALHSLSKRSNLAGYRVGTITGDPDLVHDLLTSRKHLGHIVPAPSLAAAAAALTDVQSAQTQRNRYRARREVLITAFTNAGFRVDESAGSLFLWLGRDEDCWLTVRALSEVGILVAPGEFYGTAGTHHIRVALTASDEAIAMVPERLAALA
jgi:succinyldiaminopimelate transaminase